MQLRREGRNRDDCDTREWNAEDCESGGERMQYRVMQLRRDKYSTRVRYNTEEKATNSREGYNTGEMDSSQERRIQHRSKGYNT